MQHHLESRGKGGKPLPTMPLLTMRGHHVLYIFRHCKWLTTYFSIWARYIFRTIIKNFLILHERFKLDIVDAKGTYNNIQLISKIFSGLSSKYNNSVDQQWLLTDDVEVKLKDITAKLLTYESKLLE